MSSVWLEKRFLTYAIGLTIDRFGNALYSVVLPLMVYSITQSAISMSIMVICDFFPRALCSLFIGSIVDRISRRVVIISALLFQGICSLVIALLYSLGSLEIWMLYVLGALIGIGFEFSRTAEIAIVPAMFKERRVEATSGLASAHTMMFILGPAIAGAMMGLLSYSALLWINALTYFGPIVMCLWSGIPNEKDLGGVRSTKQVVSDMGQGMKYLFSQKHLVSLLLVIAVQGIASSSGVLTLVLFHLKNDLSASDSLLSWVIACNGFGLFISSLIVPRFKNAPQGKFMFVSLLANLLGLVLFLIPQFWVLPLAQVITAIGSFAFLVSKDVVIQSAVANEMMGRIGGAMRMISNITMSISTAILGGIAGLVGSEAAFLTTVALMITALVLIFKSSLFVFGEENRNRAAAETKSM